MTIRLFTCAPENHQFPHDAHCKRLAGMNFKTTNFLLFKLIRSYWLIDEILNNEIVGYHKVLFEIEIKPFWKK